MFTTHSKIRQGTLTLLFLDTKVYINPNIHVNLRSVFPEEYNQVEFFFYQWAPLVFPLKPPFFVPYYRLHVSG